MATGVQGGSPAERSPRFRCVVGPATRAVRDPAATARTGRRPGRCAGERPIRMPPPACGRRSSSAWTVAGRSWRALAGTLIDAQRYRHCRLSMALLRGTSTPEHWRPAPRLRLTGAWCAHAGRTVILTARAHRRVTSRASPAWQGLSWLQRLPAGSRRSLSEPFLACVRRARAPSRKRAPSDARNGFSSIGFGVLGDVLLVELLAEPIHQI